MARVEIVNVTKRLGATLAVDRLSLVAEEGKFTTLLGPSGCGKTTLLRIVAGFYRPDAGEVRIGGQVMTDVPPYRRNTAMVFQEYALFPHMTVLDNVTYGLRKRGLGREQAAARAREVLHLVDLHGVERKFPHELSGGQQQRVALARALAIEPQVLLLDEPLSNLDAKLRVRVRGELRALQRAIGKTTLYVTHDQEEALSISDVVAVMRDGRIVQVGSPAEVYYAPRTAFVADFVGIANFVRGRMRGTWLEADGITLRLAVAQTRPDGDVTAIFRPEAVRVFTTPPDGDNVVAGEIVNALFHGPVARYWVRVRRWTWTVDVHDPHGGLLGGTVYLQVPADRLHLVQADEIQTDELSPVGTSLPSLGVR
ncbi:MAG: ABC transporter ATP-binding protein [Armatimonadota bacterium]|nr:ABC transporter ATP-binding protein [Armatimonadota bacterium]